MTKQLQSECCKRPLDDDTRYCPCCGHECRVEIKRGDYGGLICRACDGEFLSLDPDGLCEYCSWVKANLEEPYTINEDPVWKKAVEDYKKTLTGKSK